jgi:hypothetical protein
MLSLAEISAPIHIHGVQRNQPISTRPAISRASSADRRKAASPQLEFSRRHQRPQRHNVNETFYSPMGDPGYSVNVIELM